MREFKDNLRISRAEKERNRESVMSGTSKFNKDTTILEIDEMVMRMGGILRQLIPTLADPQFEGIRREIDTIMNDINLDQMTLGKMRGQLVRGKYKRRCMIAYMNAMSRNLGGYTRDVARLMNP